MRIATNDDYGVVDYLQAQRVSERRLVPVRLRRHRQNPNPLFMNRDYEASTHLESWTQISSHHRHESTNNSTRGDVSCRGWVSPSLRFRGVVLSWVLSDAHACPNPKMLIFIQRKPCSCTVQVVICTMSSASAVECTKALRDENSISSHRSVWRGERRLSIPLALHTC
jgi:hypothetical protein